MLEMKGEHLENNTDTNYKKAVLQLLTKSFSKEGVLHVGEASLLKDDGTNVHCDLVLFREGERKTRLPAILR